MTFKEYLKQEKSDFIEVLKKNSKHLVDLEGKPMNIIYILNKKIDVVYGFELYKVACILKLNIEKVANTFFVNIPFNRFTIPKDTKGLNSFEKFVNQFLVDQKDVASSAGIDPTRFNKVLKRDRNDFYAYEVYHLSISQKIKAKRAFEQLYKNVDVDRAGNE
ncbi:hypothetical protein [Sphingobacterium paucimobilis]|uniref:Uncharacterized protein n=1 Tax=Sphingobacterium paucimobilis HER1398 TaxID=1346330 RepID=U2HE74_9SPHI|nr:hypothetical protein [Sphingobacterium paucimobilis]ERJ60036.1 hypothetical protein M472_14825 [Sphingobacterium paucimobilis HER1398]